MDMFAERRRWMVDRQIAARGIKDPRLLSAMRQVPREAFVSASVVELAYEDIALPIDLGQTISQPFVVALMTEALALDPSDRVLEVGTGSGYAAAILSLLGAEVYTIERHERLALAAADRLRHLGYENVQVRHGDGTLGWAEQAPFDAISVTAGGPDVPPSLLSQLGLGGRLVMPIGPTPRLQELVRVTRTIGGYRTEPLGQVQFVPLVGAEGHPSQ